MEACPLCHVAVRSADAKLHCDSCGLSGPAGAFAAILRLRGTGRRAAKVDAGLVRAIRRRLANGEKALAIAVELGISKSLVSHIKSGRRWAHVV